MPEDTSECPLGHSGERYRVVRDGWADTKDGRRQYFKCVDQDGSSHRFYGDPGGDQPRDQRRTRFDVTCPEPGHKDAVIQSRGTRTTSTGKWRRFLCVRPNGSKHMFRVMVVENGLAAATPTTPPPPCPEHPTAKVVRAGTYGKRSPRQRYVCRPEGGKPHQFTPPLSREAVSAGQSCKRCDELLSPHHGPVTAARHTPWTLIGVAQALNDLSLGESYANVSLALRAQRDAAHQHLEQEHGISAFTRTEEPIETGSKSHSRRQRRNSWRVAADLVEQYSPALFAEVGERYKADAQRLRDANDDALAHTTGATLRQPVVYVLDEFPVWTAPVRGKPKRPEWFVLTAIEVRWHLSKDPAKLPERETRLRLARAFPRSNADAWKLVLDELAVRPDFVVTDKGSGLQAALASYYGSSIGIVPSLWHIHLNLRDALLKLDNTTYLEGKEKVLVDPLRKHLSLLSRDELFARTAADITTWWDELELIVTGLPAPVAPVQTQRAMHEPRLVAALPILTAYPHVPASNAAVENRIRVALKPFLENRAHMFGNAERTNRLLNLVVCRQAGVFTSLDDLALRIRQMNELTSGWAPAPRQILDKQPPAVTSRSRRYASLKSHSVINKLAKDKGIATTVQAAAAAPLPNFTTKPRPQTVTNLPVREWARSVGLPGSPRGPIRASVQAAYEAAQKGATNEEALALYEQAEKDRLAKNDKSRAEKWSSAAQRQRLKRLAPIRKWAADNGYSIGRRAPIPPNVMEAYEAAQKGKTAKRRPSKGPQSKQAKP